jgi:N-methylhydantoinase A
VRGPQGAAAGVDVGGTFTDVVLVGPDRTPRAVKVPTTPDDQSEAVASGVDDAQDAHEGYEVAVIAHGTTTATNAVLERDVARTVLVTTSGFRDLLVIGRQTRPSLYDLAVTRPAPLVPEDLVVTVEERIASGGEVVVALDDPELRRVVDEVAALEPQAVAVSLLFSYAHPEHEERLCAALEERLGVPVTRSSALLPEFREYERTSTISLNAAVAPVMGRYLARLEDRLPASTVTVMTSGGGTAGIAYVAEAPVHTLLSGPAAGVVAAGGVARASGFPDAIAFDMGGTSTDVCLIRDGRPAISTEAEIGGLPFRTPAVDIVTVGAGGGSIAWIDRGGALQVGPRSAGARPGPACYGLGGTEPTVTDAHCVLGHLDPERQLGGGLELDVDAAHRVVDDLPDDAEGAHGILTVVRATMVRALRRVSTERGVDPGGLALVAYGGAGPLHATALARELGCGAVIIPPAPGVLSALGLLLAPPRYEASRTVFSSADADLAPIWQDLESAARSELERQGIAEVTSLERVADCRYRGQSHELRLELPRGRDVAAALHREHERAYGYAMPDETVEVVTVRVIAEGEPVLGAPPPAWDQGEPTEERQRTIGVDGDAVEARVLHRAALRPGEVIEGPALVEQRDTTTLLAPGDRAEVRDTHDLVITSGGPGG